MTASSLRYGDEARESLQDGLDILANAVKTTLGPRGHNVYRGERLPRRLDGRVVSLVDDGLATGYTARAAIELIRRRGASRVVLAVPVAPEDSLATMGRVADEFVVLQRPPWFLSIGEYYEDFRQTSDNEVLGMPGAGGGVGVGRAAPGGMRLTASPAARRRPRYSYSER